MKIVAPCAKVLFPELLISRLPLIEYAGRISHRSEEDMTEDTWERFITAVVMKHGDMSIIEHVSASVETLTDRGVTHEIVRHRLFSYTQESTRFVNYVKKMPPSFLYPKPDVKCPKCLSSNQPVKFPDGWFHCEGKSQFKCLYDRVWLEAIDFSEESYRKLIASSWRPQEARSVFPNALASKIVTTGNLRMWRHHFIMRTTKETHPQYREWSIPLLLEFQRAVPVLFDDIIPEASQAQNMRLPQ